MLGMKEPVDHLVWDPGVMLEHSDSREEEAMASASPEPFLSFLAEEWGE